MCRFRRWTANPSCSTFTCRTRPLPPAGGPVIVAIHGGGWRRFNKDGYGLRVASAFVSDGYVVVAPNYVLSGPESPTWPVNFEDVQAAVRWVRGNAGTLDINPNEIAAMGESAGANLAALLGTYSTQNSSVDGVSAAVDAVVATSTPTDLTTLYAQSRGGGLAAAQFLGGSPQQVPANYIAASPIDHVSPGDPPMLLVHGLQDPLIPVSQSRELAGRAHGGRGPQPAHPGQWRPRPRLPGALFQFGPQRA